MRVPRLLIIAPLLGAAGQTFITRKTSRKDLHTMNRATRIALLISTLALGDNAWADRLDDVIVFHYLEPAEVRRIAAIFVDELTHRLAARHVQVEVDEAVLDKLAEDGFDPVYGARPLRREVERQLENPLAMMMVTGQCPLQSRVRARLEEGQIRLEVCPLG